MTNPDLHRAPRIPVGVRSQQPLRGALAAWNVEVLSLTALEPAIVEAIRLRAATHHDCHT